MVYGLNRNQVGDVDIVEEAELASNADVLFAGAFAIVSVTASTKTVVLAPGTELSTERVQSGDIVRITGGAASGTYSYNAMVDDVSFTVNEPILNASSGSVNFYYPIGSKKVGFIHPDFISLNAYDAIVESRGSAFGNDLDSKQFGRPGTVNDAYLFTMFNVDSYNSPDCLGFNVYFRKLSYACSNTPGNFTLELYKVNPSFTTRSLVWSETFSGRMNYSPAEQLISVDKGYGLYVRSLSLTGVKPADINVIVWLRQR